MPKARLCFLVISLLLLVSCGRTVDPDVVVAVKGRAPVGGHGDIVYLAPLGQRAELSRDGLLPIGVSHLRFRGLDNGGVPVYGPVTLDRAATLKLERVPTSVSKLVVELVEGSSLLAATSVPVQVAANRATTVRNPYVFVLAPTSAEGMGGASHGYFYHLATSLTRATWQAGSDIHLSSNGPANGISHRAGSSEIIVGVGGTYLVEYQAYLSTGIGASLALAVNGSVQPETVALRHDSYGLVSGRAILSLAAGDVLTLRNNERETLTLSLAKRVGLRLSMVQLGDSAPSGSKGR